MKKLSNELKYELLFDLINVFNTTKTPTESALLLQDLLTANEIRNLAIRLRIAKLLLNKKTQREIMDITGSSLATVNKVNNWLNLGGEGLKRAIYKLPHKYQMPKAARGVPIEFQGPQVLAKLVQYSLVKGQEKPVSRLAANMEKKRLSDKSLHEAYKDYYKK